MESDEGNEYLRLQEEIYKAIDSLYFHANSIHRAWVRRVARREISRRSNKISGSDRTSYELKINESGVGFSMYWYRVSFSEFGGKKRRMTKLVSLIDGCYKVKSFKHASDWEIEQIMDIEKRYKPIRGQMKNLLRMHRSLSYACSWAGGKMIAVKLSQRVKINIATIPEMKKKLMS